MSGPDGVITIACDETDAVRSLERAYKAVTTERPDDEGGAWLRVAVLPRKNEQLLVPGLAKMKNVTLDTDDASRMPLLGVGLASA